MIRGENFPLHTSVGLDGGTSEPVSSPEYWRNRRPTLILNHAVHAHGNYKAARGWHELTEVDNPNPAVVAFQQQLFQGVRQSFAETDCPIVEWRPGNGRVETEEHFLALNVLDLGPLNDEQRTAMAIPVEDEKSFWKFVSAYNEASPQNWPAVREVGGEMKLPGSSNPPTFVNVLMREIQPDDDFPQSLEPKKVEGMGWVDMAHYGTWKVVQVFWANVNGSPQFKGSVFSTLEGGRPMFGPFDAAQTKGDLDQVAPEIGRRLKIFSQVKEEPLIFKESAREPISREVWNDLPAVKDLIATGRLLGEQGLISGPVNIDKLAKGAVLPKVLEHMAKYSRQAESARKRWEPLIGAYIVTKTGRLGGSKTDMKPSDMVAAEINEQDELELIRVKGRKTEPPSIEVGEFLKPYRLLAQEVPDLFFKVRLNEDGSYTADENGDYTMARITGIDHLHRDVKVDEIDRSKIIVLETEDFDAVGCGVDANDEKSGRAVRQGYYQAKEFFAQNGYWPTAAVFYVPNHGWNAILFANEDQDGRIESDLGKPFRDAIENGSLVYGSFAEAVTQV